MKIPGRPDNVGESRAKVAVRPEWQSLQSKMDLWPVIAGDPLSFSWKLDSSILFHAEPIYVNIGIFSMRERGKSIFWY
jgi:hypothetical protein